MSSSQAREFLDSSQRTIRQATRPTNEGYHHARSSLSKMVEATVASHLHLIHMNALYKKLAIEAQLTEIFRKTVETTHRMVWALDDLCFETQGSAQSEEKIQAYLACLEQMRLFYDLLNKVFTKTTQQAVGNKESKEEADPSHDLATTLPQLVQALDNITKIVNTLDNDESIVLKRLKKEQRYFRRAALECLGGTFLFFTLVGILSFPVLILTAPASIPLAATMLLSAKLFGLISGVAFGSTNLICIGAQYSEYAKERDQIKSKRSGYGQHGLFFHTEQREMLEKSKTSFTQLKDSLGSAFSPVSPATMEEF